MDCDCKSRVLYPHSANSILRLKASSELRLQNESRYWISKCDQLKLPLQILNVTYSKEGLVPLLRSTHSN